MITNEKGYTLIELIAVIAVIGILLGTIGYNVVSYHERQENFETARHEEIINDALRLSYSVNGYYPEVEVARTLLENHYNVVFNDSLYDYQFDVDADNKVVAVKALRK